VSTVSTFFQSYGAAFERLDPAAIADHFAFPAHVTGDAGTITLTVIKTRPEWLPEIERICAMYRAIGVASTRVLDLKATEVTPRLFHAAVHWSLHDGAGRSLYDFQAIYTLGHIDGGLRITAIAHNELPRYRECLSRLQAQRPPAG
jgi:hypothetical protein